MIEQHSGRPPADGLGRSVTLAMAFACGVAVANIYYNQPVLGIMEADYPQQRALVGFVPTATQLGYAAGIFLLVPLGDFIERRRLILTQVAALAVALLAVAVAPNPMILAFASMLVGMASSVAQQIIPFGAELVPPERRGRTIGTLMSGLLAGILFARTLAGFVGHLYGWRATFAVAIGLVAVAGLLLAAVLPRSTPRVRINYLALLRSMGELLRELPALRRTTAMQMALFASFSAFWTILALRLQLPPFGMGANVAGLFGLTGIVNVVMAPMVGRLADARGPRVGILLGTLVALGSWLAFGFWATIPAYVIGAMMIDAGIQGAMVSNQHVVYGLRPEARNRLNTIFVGGIFLGGAIGSAGATLCWNTGGWNAVCVFGAALAFCALVIQLWPAPLARRVA